MDAPHRCRSDEKSGEPEQGLFPIEEAEETLRAEGPYQEGEADEA